MTTGATTTITIQARDAASGTLRQLGQRMEDLNTRARNMQRGMQGLNFVLGFAGLGSIAGIAAHQIQGMVSRMQEARQAAATLQTRMILAGLSVDQARSAVQTLNAALSNTAMAGMRNVSEEALLLMGIVGGPVLASFADLSEQLEHVTDIPARQWIEALLQAAAGSPEQLLQMAGGADSVEEAMRRLNLAMEEHEKSHTPWQTAMHRTQAVIGKLVTALEMWEAANQVLVSGLMKGWNDIKAGFATFADDFLARWGRLWSAITSTIPNFFAGLWSGMQTAWSTIQGWWQEVLGRIRAWWGQTWQVIIDGIAGLFLGVFTAMKSAWSTIQGWWGQSLDSISQAWSGLWGSIADATGGLITRVFAVLITVWTPIKDWFGTIFQAISSLWTSVWDNVRSGVSGIFGALAGALVTNFAPILTWWGNAVQGIPGALAGLGGQLWSLGVGIMGSFWAGLMSQFSQILASVRAFATSILAEVKSGLGDLIGFSPSPLGIQIGQDLMAGIERGIGSMRSPDIDLNSLAPAPRSLPVGRSADRQVISSAPLFIQIGGQTFARAVIEVLNDQIRLREPGAGLA
jgi:hypothetical protein